MRNAKLIKTEKGVVKRDLHSRIKKLMTRSSPAVNLLGDVAISSYRVTEVIENYDIELEEDHSF